MKELRNFGLNTNNNVFIVAEIGINHGGNINIAKRLIDSVSKTGADAVKFQTYITEKRTYKDSSIFDILKKCELPFDAFQELKEYTKQYNLEFFSTPFDEESIKYLKSIDCNLYKIASFDVVNHKLLTKIADIRKTVIMSVGMSDLNEIKKAYKILKSKTNKIAILHCISAYPTKEEDANLAAIYILKENFDCVIGQSDHTNDIVVPLYAVAAGAQVIEKHYKIDNKMNCIDDAFSITEEQMKKLVNEVRRIERIWGEGTVKLTEAQNGCKIYRRHSELI